METRKLNIPTPFRNISRCFISRGIKLSHRKIKPADIEQKEKEKCHKPNKSLSRSDPCENPLNGQSIQNPKKRPDEGHMAPRMLFVQSDKRALNIDLETKKGMLSNGKGHSDFASTTSFLGAIEIDVPDEIIQLCLNFQPKNGDRIAHGVYIA